MKLDEYHVYVPDDDFDTCMLVVCENKEDLERKLPIDNYLQEKDIGYEHAIRDPRWLHVMQEEIDNMWNNVVQTLEPLPPDKKPLKCIWVFKIKPVLNGEVDKHKAWLNCSWRRTEKWN